MIKNKKNLFDSKNVFHDLPVMNSLAGHRAPQRATPWAGSKSKNLLNNTNAIKEKNLASGSNITDKEGLERAYASPSNTYVIGDTLYIAGTQFGRFLSGMIPSHWGSGEFSVGSKDVWDDISKVPVWGDVKNSSRYGEAHKIPCAFFDRSANDSLKTNVLASPT